MEGISPETTRNLTPELKQTQSSRERVNAQSSNEARKAPPSGQIEQTPRTDQPQPKVTFRLNRQTDRFYIQVVDQKTGEVLRQIPPDELIRISESMSKTLGNLLDTQA